MNIYKLTPDKSVNFKIDDYGKINLKFGPDVYINKCLFEENETISRSYFYKRSMIDANKELYIIEYLPLNATFALFFDKDDWMRNQDGSYNRRVLEFYCDDNGLETIFQLKEITMIRGGLLTPSVYDKRNNEYQNFKDVDKTKVIMEKLYLIGSHNRLDFLIKHIEIFKDQNCYERALVESLTSANMKMMTKYYSRDVIIQLLRQANRDRLFFCGDVINISEKIVAYRGIPNKEEKLRSQHVFWSLDSGIATFFAKNVSRNDRFPDSEPAVYKAIVPPQAVYFYNNSRNEQEIVIDAELCDEIEELKYLPESINPNMSEVTLS